MPRHPHIEPAIAALGGSVYSALGDRLARMEGERFEFHVGDTWLEPPEPARRFPDVPPTTRPRPNRYADPRGLAPLVEALVERIRARRGIPLAGPDSVLIAPGATGALAAAALATVGPGDEVMLLAPYWPLIRGAIVEAHATPVDVPILHESVDASDVTEALASRLTPRTAAVYLNTPSNPTGKVLPRGTIEAIAEFARRHDLWVWADEVYEDFVYDGEHVSIGSLVPERTLTALSFSKAYGMAGFRVGYLAGPPPAIRAARKVGTYAWYSVPTPAQYTALEVLDAGEAWIEQARALYAEVGREVAARLGVAPPQGSTFLFLDVREALDEQGLVGFLADALDEGILLAPGPSFGSDFDGWVRLCFTATPPQITLCGVERLAGLLARRTA